MTFEKWQTFKVSQYETSTDVTGWMSRAYVYGLLNPISYKCSIYKSISAPCRLDNVWWFFSLWCEIKWVSHCLGQWHSSKRENETRMQNVEQAVGVLCFLLSLTYLSSGNSRCLEKSNQWHAVTVQFRQGHWTLIQFRKSHQGHIELYTLYMTPT